MGEEWRDVVGWEGFYQVSSAGNVKSVDRRIKQNGRFGVYTRIMKGKMLKHGLCTNGYISVGLTRPGRKPRAHLVHRLVAFAFLGKPSPGMEVCHGNGIRSDNRVVNLRWATRSENHADKKKHGTNLSGEQNPMHKLDENSVLEIRSSNETLAVLSKRFGVSQGHLSLIKNRKAWRHVSEKARLAP